MHVALYTYIYIFLSLFILAFGHAMRQCKILVSQPGIEPMPPAMEAWRLNCWTAREVPVGCFLK